MLTEAEIQEYLDEIRKQVCSRCVERPPGGPPCAPLGKECGIETHLSQLIDSIHEVNSDYISRYLAHNREKICQDCALLNTDVCPCPLHYLAVLIVEAVETVDERRRERAAVFTPGTVEQPVRTSQLEGAFRALRGKLPDPRAFKNTSGTL